MPLRTFGVAALFAAACASAAIVAAPAALADDSCDPAVTICDTPGNVEINDSPPPPAVDQYPFDNEWYFNPAGGGTPLQPEHPSGGGGGGGGHR